MFVLVFIRRIDRYQPAGNRFWRQTCTPFTELQGSGVGMPAEWIIPLSTPKPEILKLKKYNTKLKNLIENFKIEHHAEERSVTGRIGHWKLSRGSKRKRNKKELKKAYRIYET